MSDLLLPSLRILLFPSLASPHSHFVSLTRVSSTPGSGLPPGQLLLAACLTCRTGLLPVGLAGLSGSSLPPPPFIAAPRLPPQFGLLLCTQRTVCTLVCSQTHLLPPPSHALSPTHALAFHSFIQSVKPLIITRAGSKAGEAGRAETTGPHARKINREESSR